MKAIGTIGILLVSIGVILGIHSAVVTYHINQAMAPLKLADDASTPQQKSAFLQQFLDQMSVENLPEFAAFWFPNERDRVSNQIKVVESLKRRLDDLSKVDPGSLGYATGMQQVSGTEFDHATSQIGDIFEYAMVVRSGWFALYGWTIFVVIGGVMVVAYIMADG